MQFALDFCLFCAHGTHGLQEDEGEDDTDFTPMSHDNPGGSRRTFSIDSIIPHRSVDPRPARPSRLGSTSSGRLRDRSGKHWTRAATCPTGSDSPLLALLQPPMISGY